MIAFIWQNDWEALAFSFVRRLADVGHEVSFFARGMQRDEGALEAALPAGVRRASSLAAAVKQAEVVLTLLSSPQEVEDVYLGEGGVLEKAAPASRFIDLSTSSPRLAKELNALAAVHDHSFIEAPLEGGVIGGESGADDAAAGGAAPAAVTPTLQADALRILAAGEPADIESALPLLRVLTPQVIVAGLPGSAVALKLASQIGLAGALMGVIEAITFAKVSGVADEHIFEVVSQSAAASEVSRVFGKKVLSEDFSSGPMLRLFFNDLASALEAADELELALPGLETAHQLYDLLVLVGGGPKGIHALALIYYDEVRCAQHGLNWELAQRAMDVYERAGDNYDDYDYDYDDEDCDDPNCNHPHHHHSDGDDKPPSMSGFFSSN
ncbi:MAG: NAD(P)-dependent oxidoreductase [Coriobacteriales bacterium]|jgi:3-hydroxyisobutyrate dehydrogenase|nr:NAD(P)-dependent oxidoreductase [Coriobacteriales bacterium]